MQFRTHAQTCTSVWILIASFGAVADGITSVSDMTAVPHDPPDLMPPALSAVRGLRSRVGKIRLTELIPRRQRAEAAGRHPDGVLKELSASSADPEELNRDVAKDGSLHTTGSPLKNGKVPPHEVAADCKEVDRADSPVDGGSGGHTGRGGKRSYTVSGRGKGQRAAANVSLVRSSSRKKIKKSLGPDFLDPNDLNSQMKQKASDVDVDKSCRDDSPVMRCNQCNQRVRSDLNKKFLDSVTKAKWICSSCLSERKRACCFCGEMDAEFLCPSCEEPNNCNSFHHKCILQQDTAGELDPQQWKCKECELEGEEGALDEVDTKGEAEVEEYKQPEVTAVPNVPLVEEEDNHRVCSNELKSNVETESKKDIRVADVAIASEAMARKEPEPLRKRKPETWSVEDVATFIESTGFEKEALTFKDQEIDGKSLLLMKRNDVITGLNLKVGPALKIFSFISHLQIFRLVSSETSLK